MSLRESVTPRNNAFGGGTLARATPPTSVGGAFQSAGAAGFTAPGVPGIVSARNNSGSNVRVPYARVVPLHSHDALQVKDEMGLDRKRDTMEYEGLKQGEVAWVLGHAYASKDFEGEFRKRANPDKEDKRQPIVSALNPVTAMGHGPDRMQRLAYTGYVEAHFEERIGRQDLNLLEFDFMAEPLSTQLGSELAFWKTRGVAVGDLFAMPDLAWALQTPVVAPTAPQVGDIMMQGLFAMERGPFLRSIGTNHRPITVSLDGSNDLASQMTVDRHLGSGLAQEGLALLLKSVGVFNWVPDGVCLSKYETGPDAISDAYMDARASQLFNVAVQGPAITNTWSSDSMMSTLPMDKVFVVVVGDLWYTTGESASSNVKTATAFSGELKNDPGSKVTMTNAFPADNGLADAQGNPVVAAYNDWVDAADTDKPAAWATYTAALNTVTPDGAMNTGAEFDQEARDLRNGDRSVGSAHLTNLRLMRVTSSFLINNSHYKGPQNPGDLYYNSRASRCGLPFSYNDGTKSGVASYILGGWCIGTVIDAAASRAAFNNFGVRTSASAMAININVNVEWWDADKLYQHYQDKESYADITKRSGTTAQRDQPPVPVRSELSLDVDDVP